MHRFRFAQVLWVMLYCGSWSHKAGKTENTPPPSSFCMEFPHFPLYYLPVVLLQILIQYSIFSFPFHLLTLSSPSAPLHIFMCASFHIHPHLNHPHYHISLPTIPPPFSAPASPLCFSSASTFLSPLVSRGERQYGPTSDQSRAAGLPSHCW